MDETAVVPFRSEKDSNWEGAFRVPLLVRWPRGKIPAGVVTNEIVQHHDWLPTFCTIAGDADKPKKPSKATRPATRNSRCISTATIFCHSRPLRARSVRAKASSTSTTTAIWLRSAWATGRLCLWSNAPRAHCKSGRSPSLSCISQSCTIYAPSRSSGDITSNTYWDWYMSKG
jgi:Sulfatase